VDKWIGGAPSSIELYSLPGVHPGVPVMMSGDVWISITIDVRSHETIGIISHSVSERAFNRCVEAAVTISGMNDSIAVAVNDDGV